MKRDHDDRVSTAIKAELRRLGEEPWLDPGDHKRMRLIVRLGQLEDDVPLNARMARNDLDMEGYNHNQPCHCNLCFGRTTR